MIGTGEREDDETKAGRGSNETAARQGKAGFLALKQCLFFECRAGRTDLRITVVSAVNSRRLPAGPSNLAATPGLSKRTAAVPR